MCSLAQQCAVPVGQCEGFRAAFSGFHAMQKSRMLLCKQLATFESDLFGNRTNELHALPTQTGGRQEKSLSPLKQLSATVKGVLRRSDLQTKTGDDFPMFS